MEDETVAPLVRQIPWTHHLIIFSQCQRLEYITFFLSMAEQEQCGKRALSERVVRIRTKPSAALTQTQTDSCTAMGVVAWAPV
jgi:hypothetical protein